MEGGNMEAGQGKARARAGSESVEGYAQRYVEDAHGLRLMALLNGMVHEHDVRWAAEQLGVDARTVSTCLRRGRVSGHVRGALDLRLLREREMAVREETAAQVSELTERVAALTSGLAALRESVGETIDALREEQASAIRELEQRVAGVEAHRHGGPVAGGGTRIATAPSPTPGKERPVGRRVRRETNPKVVTAEADGRRGGGVRGRRAAGARVA